MMNRALGLCGGAAPRLARIAAGAALLASAACGGGSDATAPATQLSSVLVDPSTATMAVGGSRTFTATPRSAEGLSLTPASLTWSSSNPAVATVAAGVVSAVSAGIASITATATLAGRTAQGTAVVTVPVTVTIPPVTAVSVAPTTDTLFVAQTVQLRATPVDAAGVILTGRPATWSTSNAAIATVSTDGLVTARGSGTAIITVTVEEKTAAATVVTLPVIAVAPVSLAAGSVHTCALSTAGAAYCWGYNARGSVGDGTTVPRTTPVPVAGSLTFASLVAGDQQTCGLTPLGKAYCWGADSSGVLGNGTHSPPADQLTPVAVSFSGTFVRLAAGLYHTCGLAPSGEAYCWGNNSSGQLGDGTLTSRSVPGPVSSTLLFVSLTAGERHTCGVTTTGQAWCWGEDVDGQLGDDSLFTGAPHSTPVPVSGGFTWAAIQAGQFHTCGRTTGNIAYCWGRNTDGQLGDGTTVQRRAPVPVVGTFNFTKITASGFHSCGITTTGSTSCWGSNTFGQLGDGTTTSRLVPTPIQFGGTLANIVAGSGHTCAQTSVGALYCWGLNDYGQLGDGSLTRRSVPAPVLGGVPFATPP
jgi:alpha-tubulin suppressor-like RCC1 family protein